MVQRTRRNLSQASQIAQPVQPDHHNFAARQNKHNSRIAQGSRSFTLNSHHENDRLGINFSSERQFRGAENTASSFRQSPANYQDSEYARSIPVTNLESKYHNVFTFRQFNTIQTMAFKTAIFDDVPMVISSPTGSGKTVVFELTIIRLLMQLDKGLIDRMRVIYVAPVKALCSEKAHEWSSKFGSFGVKCTEFTGDTDGSYDAYFLTQETSAKALVVLTTPEKLDSLTRRWRSFSAFIMSIDLLLIDEVHLLNEPKRGPTVEAVVSRMKTIRMFKNQGAKSLRIVACSATIPNACDIGEWLSTNGKPAALFQVKEEERPVPLQKIVLGYPYSAGSSLFKFDISLNYKLTDLLRKYSNDKPVLIFCSSRKGAQQTASYLAKNIFSAGFPYGLRKRLVDVAYTLQDAKLKEVTEKGVSYHHAGLSANDRRVIEQLFLCGDLPVLVSTSTLALGVNLPAHLVIVKSTTQIVAGKTGEEYSSTQVLQMIGRAGRPQFDTEATAIIMTQSGLREHYEKILHGADTIESCLHLSLKEHLNAEVVLQTITDASMAVSWLRTTFLYIRALKNPLKYKIQVDSKNSDQKSRQASVERHLYDLCLRELNALNRLELITMDEAGVAPTQSGRLMARYYIAYDTMVLFSELGANENMSSLLEKLCNASEFSDVQLRSNERRALNLLNKSKTDETIRFPMKNRITTRQMKINCLIQATLGCVPVSDSNLAQECPKILRLAHRLSKCLVEYIYSKCLRLQSENNTPTGTSFLNAVILAKCLKCQLWENSEYVAKQIERIGLNLSRNLVEAGFTTFSSLGFAHPQAIERACKRSSPFGNALLELVHRLPSYSLNVQQKPELRSDKAMLELQISLRNYDTVARYGTSAGKDHSVYFVVIDADKKMLINTTIKDTELMATPEGFQLVAGVTRAKNGDELQLYVISDAWVGLDVKSNFTPRYSRTEPRQQTIPVAFSIAKATSKRTNDSAVVPQSKQSAIEAVANFDLTLPDSLIDCDEDEEEIDNTLRGLDDSILEDFHRPEEFVGGVSSPMEPQRENELEPPHSPPLTVTYKNLCFGLESPSSPMEPNIIEDIFLACDPKLYELPPGLSFTQPESRKRNLNDEDDKNVRGATKKSKSKEFESKKSSEFKFDFQF